MPLQEYSSHLLAKAVTELFPEAKIMTSESSGVMFSCEWICSQAIDRGMLPLIEEKMRGWAKKPLAARFQEMVPQNAASFFEDRGQPYLADSCLDLSNSLATLILLEEYAGLASFPFEVPSSFFMQLLTLSNKEGVFRVEGIADYDQKSVKEYVKVYKLFQKRDPEQLARLGNYFFKTAAGDQVILPKGLEFRDFFKNLFFDHCPADFLKVSAPVESNEDALFDLKEVLESCRENCVVDWHRTGDLLVTSLLPEEGEAFLNSSLQLFEKTARILGFESQRVLGEIMPPPYVKEKKGRSQWKTWGKWLTDTLGQKKSSFDLVRSDTVVAGPYIQYLWMDPLGRTIEGPRITLVCYKQGYPWQEPKTEALLIARELFPDWGQLLYKLIENGSLKNVEAELKKKLES